MHTRSLLALTAGLALQCVSAAPAIIGRQTESPCERINAQVVEFTQRNRTARLDAQEAYDCLRTIPFNSNSSVLFVQQARKAMQWQSDIETLRDPPSQAAAAFGHVDLLQGLSDIENKAQANEYSSQVDFDTDLRKLVASANDGHLGLGGLCSDSVFSFSMEGILVSIANTSTSAPEVYNYDDIYGSQNSTILPSSIVTINGSNAADFLTTYAALLPLRDADARYNALFASNARHGGPQILRGQFTLGQSLWTGYSTLNYTFANGTESSWQAIANLNSRQSRWNFTSGEELFEAFCAVSTEPSSTANGTSPSNSTSTEDSTAPTQTAFGEAYPEPIVRDPFNTLAGFYLDSDANDTAVLFIPDFETSGSDVYTQLPLPDDENFNFGKAAQDFISRAKADNKSRLILDLTANGGGVTQQGFALFKLLFPNTQIDMNNRYRNHNFSRLLMKALDTYTEDYDDQFTYPLAKLFSWAGQVSPSQTALDWTSYLNFTGPETADVSANTAFQNFTATDNPYLPIQGYSNYSTTFKSPPFSPENILIITDGYCASTCSIFVELLTTSGQVNNTLVFGGRPPAAGTAISAMELVGGTRGTQQYDWSQIAENAEQGLDYVNSRLNESKPTLSQEEITQYKALMPVPKSQFPLQFQTGSLNLRNGYRNGSDIPLEFQSQQAGCRLYYTKENLLKPATTWRDAADAIWGGKKCAAAGSEQNSTQGQSSQNSSSSNGGEAVNHSTSVVLASIVGLFAAAIMF